ncbi:MAG: PD40 domain-containing protein [Prevotella sp.]|nr:PD40 domain-containing protein [Prevotella sp.]
MKRQEILYTLLVCFALLSCTPTPTDVVKTAILPPIYPDYVDVTIPENIAPLNFLVRDDIEAVQVKAGDLIVNAKGNEVVFDEDDWHELLAANRQVEVTVTTLKDGKWTEYRSFCWEVVTDRVDPFLTYRLIEPDYEIWNNLQIIQRCVENFDEKALCDYHLADNQCMNCHATAGQNPQLSMMYVRGPKGGAILNQNGTLRKLAIKTDDMVSGSVYYGFSPSGRYITFSTNIIIPAFHSRAGKRLEVFDSKSDVYVADLQENRIIRSPLLSDSLTFETFPTFSPDGKYIYYCAAAHVQLPLELKQLQYDLVRIPFDEKTGSIGNKVDTVSSAATPSQQGKHSVCHPRISPDGRYLVYTVADYGTFPIWHQEADLQMMDLKTGRIDTMAVVNSDRSDTYHAWSSNSRWLVFASKRDDGLYGKPYFCYIDRNGKPHKPFVLPQQSPTCYDHILKSFNAPELSKGELPFNAVDVARILKKEAEPFH